MRKQTQKEVIERAMKVHGDEYDYSKVSYQDMNTKVEIICQIHGSFWQTPSKHILAEQGCHECSGHAKLDMDIVITRAREIHGMKYDYSKAIYVNNVSQIEIICPEHGSFWQRVADHIGKDKQCGCQTCAGSKPLDMETIEKRGCIIHNSKYNYDNAMYVNMHTKIEIVCPIHGSFWQTPTNHIDSEKGCEECGGSAPLNVDIFRSRSKVVHNDKYDYSKVVYENNKTKVEIICRKHGSFWQTPHDHMDGGYGCPSCHSVVSKPEIEWLDYLGIPIEYRSSKRNFRLLNGKLVKPDAYDPTTKTVYEFYGDYWHGNPNRYPADKKHPVSKKTYGELYSNTMKREKELRAEGYKVVSIWESDWNITQSKKEEGNDDDSRE